MGTTKRDAVSLYHEARRPQYHATGSYQVPAPIAWDCAKRDARTLRLWAAADSAGLVRLDTVADDYHEPLDADAYDPATNPGYPGGARALAAERKRAERKRDTWGVVCVVGRFRTSPDDEWQTGDSICGIEGDENPEHAHGYGPDVMGETLAQLRTALRAEHQTRADLRRHRCPHCRGTGRPNQ